MKKRRVTAKDVAELAGVSPSAVSMILNNYKNINFSDDTRKRVLDACDQLGYRTAGNSQHNSISGKIILVIYPSLRNAHYVKVVEGVQARACELGYTPLSFCTRRSQSEEADIVQICRELHVAGAIFAYQPDNDSVVHLIGMERPLVLLYDKEENQGINVIGRDNYKIGRLVAEHLVGLGHKQIALVSAPLTERKPARIRRTEGIRSYLAECGLDPQQHLRISTVQSEHLEDYEHLEGYETGYILAGHLLDNHVPVTAFAAMNDVVAYGIMDAILERGKRIPQDYSVCGCDNLQSSGFQRISLTTVEPYTMEQARDAVDTLVQKIGSWDKGPMKKKRPVSITRIEYQPQLIVRKSTGRCPERTEERGN